MFANERQDGLRNHSSYWRTVRWLRAKFIFLMSGYLSPRGMKDYGSYLALIERPELKEHYSKLLSGTPFSGIYICIARQPDGSAEIYVGEQKGFGNALTHIKARLKLRITRGSVLSPGGMPLKPIHTNCVTCKPHDLPWVATIPIGRSAGCETDAILPRLSNTL